MAARTFSQFLTSPGQTDHLARLLSAQLSVSDIILLSGDVGTGKTHFARHLIRSMQQAPEDIPSPTFTLVQTYDTRRGPVWHCDLYRVSSVWEIEELGLTEAFDNAICLIEWPDRLGDLRPDTALEIEMLYAESEDERQLTARWHDPKWDEKLKVWAG